MKTVIGGMSTPQATIATGEHVDPAATATHGPDDEHADEAFEATILRLDGTAFEWLLRQLAE